MAASVPNQVRNDLASGWRAAICDRMGIVPFVHQRAWWCASEGTVLTDIEDPTGTSVQLPDGSVRTYLTIPRPDSHARFIADLGAFKIGKSYGVALWAAGFAAVPDARVSLIGLEYDICAPEFDYLCQFLLSDAGMGMKFDSLQNRPRDGKMWLDLPNGCRFEARSWERKDSLKGKEIDAYIYCEAYQLPGMECFTDFSQNLRAREGYAVFPTTPDRPWVNGLHDLGHGKDSQWHCTCSVPGDVNPYTFDPRAKERDRSLMTREKFAIHYDGKLGDFVGHVFNYQRGESTFSAGSAPDLFRGGPDRQHLHVPPGWEIVGGADTGTYYTALLVAFAPSGDAFVLEEFPNYRYVAGEPERDEMVTIPEWSRRLSIRVTQLGGRSSYWADANSQFKQELRQYGINLLPAKVPVETRTEITREYFQHGAIYLAPWLDVLPFELENAAWPEEASAAGKFARIKDRDHTLDCLEHILARRPRGRGIQRPDRPSTWIESHLKSLRPKHTGNAHLGAL